MTGLIARRDVLGGIAAAGTATTFGSELMGAARAATVPEAITSASATDLANAIRAKRLTSREIVAAYLDRIEVVIPNSTPLSS